MPEQLLGPVEGPVCGPGAHLLLDQLEQWEPLVIVTGVGAGAAANAAGTSAARHHGVDLPALLAAEAFRGRVGEVLRVPATAPDHGPLRWYLVGTGEGSPADLRRAGAAAARAVRVFVARTPTLVAVDLLPDGRVRDRQVQAVTEGLLLAGTPLPAQKSMQKSMQKSAQKPGAWDATARPRFALLGARHTERAIAAGARQARATLLARTLATTPPSIKNPVWLAEQAVRIAEESGLRAEIWHADRLADEGFGGLLAVGAGSATPPVMVRIDHRPDHRPDHRRPGGRRPVVLVGKGITFDSGGISLKPRASMPAMKTDMTGAAVVLAALAGCREAGVRREVIGLLPLAENAFGASSYRPGDIVKHYGGRTVEVTNTDAEGRLVLADALAYADARLDPDLIVDVATLTGAATLGLGRRHGALYATDDTLARSLIEAGAETGERLWRMPLVEDYRIALVSQLADLRQAGSMPKLGAGSVLAALFLREFTGGRRWAHLDIAGPARSEKDLYEVTKGATGFGARLLLTWLQTLR